MTQLSPTADVINTLADIPTGSVLAELRAQRPEVTSFAQGSYQTLLEASDVGGLSQVERELIGLRVGILTGNTAMADFHRRRLQALDAHESQIAAATHSPEEARIDPREAAILQFTDLLTNEPGAATPEQIAHLHAVGLQAADVVTAAQLIAYLSFQVRVLAGLRLLEEER